MNSNKYLVIALFGKSASGKDTIQKWIVSNVPETHKIISCTTREPRDYEKEGVDYFFLTEEELTNKVLNGSMLEVACFNGWFYGTPIEGLDRTKINIGVFNIAGIEALNDDPNICVLPIYVHANNKTRLLRSLNREDNPNCSEICRRFFTDEEDFSMIDFDYMTIDNDIDFNKKELLDIINSSLTNFGLQ